MEIPLRPTRQQLSLILSSGFVSLSALLLGAAAPAPALPSDTVILLVASWCAPCHREVAEVEAIAKAAWPHPVRLLSVDDTRAGRAMLARVPAWRVWTPAARDRRSVTTMLLARTPGIPYSVMTDPHGEVCAEQRGGLDPARVRGLIARCAAGADRV